MKIDFRIFRADKSCDPQIETRQQFVINIHKLEPLELT